MESSLHPKYSPTPPSYLTKVESDRTSQTKARRFSAEKELIDVILRLQRRQHMADWVLYIYPVKDVHNLSIDEKGIYQRESSQLPLMCHK